MASPSCAITTTPPWSDLLPELLGRIAACCPRPADRASFRAVCTSWRSACPRTPLLPWVLLPDGSFLTLSDGARDDLPSAVLPQRDFVKPSGGGLHRLPLPTNTTCVGSTDDWLALRRRDPSSGSDTFLLHNPFSGATVPLPGVDAAGAKAPRLASFHVRKVLLMRSAAQDITVAAVMSNSRHCPLILSSPGKGTWAPEPFADPFSYIADIAFLGDKLYGITKAEDLFSFDLDLHGDQAPSVTDCKRVIRHPLDYYDYYLPWSDIDDDDEQSFTDDDEDEEGSDDEDEDEEGFDDDDDDDEEEEGLDHDKNNGFNDDDDDDDYDDDEEEEEEVLSEYSSDSSYDQNEYITSLQVPISVDCWFNQDDEPPRDEIITIRYLVESRGKLIMVRRQLQYPNNLPRYTRKVEVFKADMDAGAWVPVSGGLDDGGQAIFIGKRFSKCVSTCEYGEGQLDDDAIYFMDTAEVFHLRSGTISPALWCLCYWDSTWVFPPDLVGY
ncbi:hypothetical protein ACP70R_005075 [Stipagrostis hirtigluma subsp. patula]